jgi:hypothetical protein
MVTVVHRSADDHSGIAREIECAAGGNHVDAMTAAAQELGDTLRDALGMAFDARVNDEDCAQIASGTILIAPQGHSASHRPQPLQ